MEVKSVEVKSVEVKLVAELQAEHSFVIELHELHCKLLHVQV